MNALRRRPKLLLFDVFGTVVDWRGSVIAELQAIARDRHVVLDAEALADAWRRGYPLAMDRVRRGELPWTPIDGLHRIILEQILADAAVVLDEPTKTALNLVWHRLRPWPDSVDGLARLKRLAIIATLSNGNVRLLVDLARSAGLPWDTVLSAELFHAYKPDPEVYLGAIKLLDVDAGEAMLVAAHKSDLDAAARCGLRTALIERPLEYGAGRHPDPGPAPRFDINARDFHHLADVLGALED